jgi:hypothetical protein
MILMLERIGKGLELIESRNEIGERPFGVGGWRQWRAIHFCSMWNRALFQPFCLIQAEGHILLVAVCLRYETIP